LAKVLIIEDNRDLVLAIEAALDEEHYEVESVYSGSDGLDRIKHYAYDVVVLDLSLPNVSGLEICKSIRAMQNLVPILIITGEHGVPQKELLLDAGADDYLTKPFNVRELRARLRAILRRAAGVTSNALKSRDMVLDPVARKVTIGDKPIDLLPKEFALLEFFMRHPGEVFTGTALLNHVWPSDSSSSHEALKMCITRLRRKIDLDGAESFIKTIHRVGYRFDSK
jgi:two-component system OmpR family response regulator